MSSPSISAECCDLSESQVPTSFNGAGMLADELLKQKADATRIIYNTFKSAISFMPTMATVVSAEVAETRAQEGGIMDAYEIEEEDRAPLLADLMEFQVRACASCIMHHAALASPSPLSREVDRCRALRTTGTSNHG